MSRVRYTGTYVGWVQGPHEPWAPGDERELDAAVAEQLVSGSPGFFEHIPESPDTDAEDVSASEAKPTRVRRISHIDAAPAAPEE